MSPPYSNHTLRVYCKRIVEANVLSHNDRYGAPFAQNGGGVFAALWDGDGIRTWFWPVRCGNDHVKEVVLSSYVDFTAR